jgi:hypothetical protein
MGMLMRKAGFIDSRACIEDIDYAPDRKINRQHIMIPKMKTQKFEK